MRGRIKYLWQKCLWGVVFVLIVSLLFALRDIPYPAFNYGYQQPSCMIFFNVERSRFMSEHHSNEYPNMNGLSLASLSQLYVRAGEAAAMASRYGYVAGLHADDPKNLVVMYFKTKSRVAYHSERITWREALRREPKWIVVCVGDGAEGEGGWFLTDSELFNQLTATLSFLIVKNRPYWSAVQREHEAFLATLKASMPIP